MASHGPGSRASAAPAAPDAASRTAPLRFTKMHGAGNDFVVLDLRGGSPPPSPTLCRAMADRHAGIGCDQLLTIEAPRSATALASYRIWNADGSSSRQCGNGARCVAAWLLRAVQACNQAPGGAEATPLAGRFELDSPAGTHRVEVLADGRYRVAMGVPEFAPAALPLAGFAEPRSRYAVDVDGETVAFGAVSIGNPHLVLEVADVDAAPVAALGPRLQRPALLPDSGNIGFAEVVARDRVRLRVFERGVGETLACGSGACAAVAVLVRQGRIDRSATVVLPGGELEITWPDDHAHIQMAGPATFVFEGEWLQ